VISSDLANGLRLPGGGSLALYAAPADGELQAGQALLIERGDRGSTVCGFMDVLHRAMRDDDVDTVAFVRREDLGRFARRLAGPAGALH